MPLVTTINTSDVEDVAHHGSILTEVHKDMAITPKAAPKRNPAPVASLRFLASRLHPDGTHVATIMTKRAASCASDVWQAAGSHT